MTIKRLSLILIVVISCTGVLTAGLFFKLIFAVNDHTRLLNEHSLAIQVAQEIASTSSGLTANVRAYAVTGDSEYKTKYNSLVGITEGKISRPKNAAVAPGEYISRVSLLSKYGLTGDELGKLTESAGLSNKLIDLEVEAMHAVEGVFKDNSGNYTRKAEPNKALATQLVFSKEYLEQTVKIFKPLEEFYVMMKHRSDQQSAHTENVVALYSWLAAGTLGALLFFSIGMGLYMYRSVSTKIAEAAAFAECVAKGDLEQCIPVGASRNEIGVLCLCLNMMTTNLRERIEEGVRSLEQANLKEKEATEAMRKVDAAGQEASQKSKDLLLAADHLENVANVVAAAAAKLGNQLAGAENNASLQAARINETTIAMEGMNATVREVARSAGDAAKVSAQTREKAEHGAKEVSQVVSSITKVQSDTIALKDNMQILSTRAQDISQIMAVISDIADQTNLLALNAAIEAARAGEAGRGFAVVADEVRKLAEKTVTSTIDVGNAIRSIQESTGKSAEQVNHAVSSIATVTQDAQRAGDSLVEIVSLVDACAVQVRGITAASEEQSVTSDTIMHTIADINSLAGSTVEGMKEASHAVHDLSVQASDLTQLIDRMKKS